MQIDRQIDCDMCELIEFHPGSPKSIVVSVRLN